MAGSETWGTLDEIDGFDIRSPVNGVLGMRVSPDAVRTIDAETTRYPVEFGRATGGVIAFFTGMGDNKFRFNATNFVPSFRSLNGIRFDKFVPRFTFSGPIARDRAWFYDGLEVEYDNIYIAELPANADTNSVSRGSNLLKAQTNVTPANILTGWPAFQRLSLPLRRHLVADAAGEHHQARHNFLAALSARQDGASPAAHCWTLASAESACATAMNRTEMLLTRSRRNCLQAATSKTRPARSQRVQGTAALYLPPRHWAGQHDFKLGIDLDRVGYSEAVARAPVNYLREDGTPLAPKHVSRRSAPFTLHNVEVGAYVQDRWQPRKGLLVEPGLRFDWDEIIRRPLVSPRIAVVYSPPGGEGTTKYSAGIGLYYEHTQLEYLTRALAGIRYDTYYAADGMTPTGAAQQTSFTANYDSLHEARALNWSVGVEHKLPWQIFAGANFVQKRTSNLFTYVNQSGPAALSGNYLLTNQRQDRYDSIEVDARRLFANGYSLFASYTRSSARTNAALDYTPTLSVLGPQQSGPLAWDTPNRAISWGWLPLPLPKLSKSWDFVYLLDWRTGFPYTAVNANRQVVGAAGSQRFPDFVNFSPGLEWKFHLRGAYFGLRGVMENATDSGESRNREQRGGFTAVRNLQRVPGQGLHGAHSPDRGKVVNVAIKMACPGR